MTRAWRRFWRRSRDMFSRGRRERELQAEVDSLHGLEADAQAARGLSQAEARRTAKLRLGGVEQLRDRGREARGWPELEAWWRDVGYGLRRLRHSPGFTAVVVLTLALGIGANTAIFSLFNALLLRPLPVRDPQHLFLLRWHAREFPRFSVGFSLSDACQPVNVEGGSSACSFSSPVYEQLRDAPGLFQELAAATGDQEFDLTRQDRASVLETQFVSGNYFSVLGVHPALGRLLQPGDDRPGAPAAVVLSSAYWRQHMGADPDVIGQPVAINRVHCTVVGVAEPNFTSLVPGAREDAWLPLALQARTVPGWQPDRTSAGFAYLDLVGRLKPNEPPAAAAATASSIWARAATHGPEPLLPAGSGGAGISLLSAQAGLRGSRAQYEHPLTLLLLGVAILLTIACANVAGLLVARSGARRREIALRRALGASGGRIFRQLLIESVMLAGLGGVAGLFLAYGGARAIAAMAEANAAQPLLLAVALDGRVLLFTAACSILAGIVFGLAPAWRGARTPLGPAMQAESGATGRSSRLGSALAVAQVTLSLILLMGAGLLLRTLHNLERTNPGFKPGGLITFGVHPSLLGYRGTAQSALYHRIQEQLRALPGVEAAGYSQAPLLSPALAEGYSRMVFERPDGVKVHPYELDIGPGYLSVLGVPLLAGRHLADPDLNPPAGQPVAVLVNRLFARGYFGSANPLGRIVGAAHGLPGFRIVGVVGDARFASQRRPVAPTIFTPGYGGRVYFTLRSSLPAAALLPAVRAAVAHVDGNLPLVDVKTQRQNQLQLLFQERLLARLGGFFGGLALLLAALGLYGLLAHEVARRQREIGIRIALGANRAHLLRRVVGRGVGLTAIGLALGAVGGWATLRVLDSILFEVQPADPVNLAGAGLLLLIAAAAASSVPARRALRCHPAEVLRAE